MANENGTFSKSGVFIYERYQDNLIIDRYNPYLHLLGKQKLNAMRSENSEDAITWNVFSSLKQIDPEIWLPRLFNYSFAEEFPYQPASPEIWFWKKLSPSSELGKEGKTEVDILIETEQFVWTIEAKYKSDIEEKTANNPYRDQVIRNVDLGSECAKSIGKDYYFSLLILNEKRSPKGVQKLRDYQGGLLNLPHKDNILPNLKGMGLLYWAMLADAFQLSSRISTNPTERFISNQALVWLEKKLE